MVAAGAGGGGGVGGAGRGLGVDAGASGLGAAGGAFAPAPSAGKPAFEGACAAACKVHSAALARPHRKPDTLTIPAN
jgi:hypothetical protein